MSTEPPAIGRRRVVHLVTGSADLFDDLRIGARDGGRRRRAITEPDAEHVGVDSEIVAAGVLDRTGDGDVVVPLTACAERAGQVLRRTTAAIHAARSLG